MVEFRPRMPDEILRDFRAGNDTVTIANIRGMPQFEIEILLHAAMDAEREAALIGGYERERMTSIRSRVDIARTDSGV